MEMSMEAILAFGIATSSPVPIPLQRFRSQASWLAAGCWGCWRVCSDNGGVVANGDFLKRRPTVYDRLQRDMVLSQ